MEFVTCGLHSPGDDESGASHVNEANVATFTELPSASSSAGRVVNSRFETRPFPMAAMAALQELCVLRRLVGSLGSLSPDSLDPMH